MLYEKTEFPRGLDQPKQEIAEKNHADEKLDRQVGVGQMGVVPGENFPREGHKQRNAGQEFQDAQGVGKSGTGGFGWGH